MVVLVVLVVVVVHGCNGCATSTGTHIQSSNLIHTTGVEHMRALGMCSLRHTYTAIWPGVFLYIIVANVIRGYQIILS